MPPTKAIEGLVFDLIHKPITKDIITRVLTHDLLTPEVAEQAVDVLYRKEFLDIDNYNLYLSFYARHGAVDKVKQGIEKAETYNLPQPKDKWHGSLARAYSAKGRVADALRHLTASRDLGVCDPKAHDSVVSSLVSRARELHDQFTVYKQERNERVKSVNMEFAENELNKKKRELLTVAYEAAQAVKNSGQAMSETTHTQLISSLSGAHMYTEALEIMQSLGHLMDNQAILDAQFFVYTSQGKLDEALDILRQVTPRLGHYVSLITYCSEKGDLETWKNISFQIRQYRRQVRPPIYGKLVDIVGKRGGYEEMEDLYREAKILFGQLNHIIYSSMITNYVNAGNIERAQYHFTGMRHYRIEPNEVAYSALLRGRLQRNEYDQADRLLAKAEDAGIRAIGPVLIEQMIPYWAEHQGAMRRCVYWLCCASRYHKAGVPLNSLFNQMLEKLAERGDMNACVEFTHDMREHDVPLCARSYTSLFRAAAAAKLEGAYDVLKDGVEKDEVIETLKLKIAMLRYAIAVNDLELSKEIMVGIHKCLKDKVMAAEMDNDDKVELLQHTKTLSKMREEQQNNKNNDNNEVKDTTKEETNTTDIKSEDKKVKKSEASGSSNKKNS